MIYSIKNMAMKRLRGSIGDSCEVRKQQQQKTLVLSIQKQKQSNFNNLAALRHAK